LLIECPLLWVKDRRWDGCGGHFDPQLSPAGRAAPLDLVSEIEFGRCRYTAKKSEVGCFGGLKPFIDQRCDSGPFHFS
jgi:hypothetical protein